LRDSAGIPTTGGQVTGLPYDFPCPDKSGWEHRNHLKELVKISLMVYEIKIYK
jgi:hypothetical protein